MSRTRQSSVVHTRKVIDGGSFMCRKVQAGYSRPEYINLCQPGAGFARNAGFGELNGITKMHAKLAISVCQQDRLSIVAKRMRPRCRTKLAVARIQITRPKQERWSAEVPNCTAARILRLEPLAFKDLTELPAGPF